MNAGIPKDSYLGEDFLFEYPSVDTLSDLLIQKRGIGGNWMLKRDLSPAYGQLRADPSDYIRLGFKWQNQYFFDVSLPFGL